MPDYSTLELDEATEYLVDSALDGNCGGIGSFTLLAPNKVQFHAGDTPETVKAYVVTVEEDPCETAVYKQIYAEMDDEE